MVVTTTALALVLGCAVAFSLADLLRKTLSDKLRATPLLFVLSAGMVPFFAAWLAWEGAAPVPARYWPPGVTSVVLNIVANLAFLAAVKRSPLSLTIPILALTPVFTTLLAVPILGEVPASRQVSGIVVVVAGILWLQADAAGGLSPLRLIRAFLREPGGRLMTLTALSWSLAMPLDKLAMASTGPAFHGLVLNGGVALGVLLLLAGRGRLGELRKLGPHWRELTAAVVVGGVALVLILLAITQVWIGFVETVKRGVGSFLAQVWGRVVFGEPLTANKLLAVAVIVLGVGLIVW